MIAEKWERIARAGFTLFLLVKDNIYCPFCSSNAEPDLRLLRWLTHVASGSVELLRGGERMIPTTVI